MRGSTLRSLLKAFVRLGLLCEQPPANQTLHLTGAAILVLRDMRFSGGPGRLSLSFGGNRRGTGVAKSSLQWENIVPPFRRGAK